ncbi:MAG: fumarate reductase/succinate dehydrogenase flavoprotein subunit, partial [Actinomycetota bacterium]|nr:fumarate reductase/succinate dehydrogenase flavoprotein subunit [Actinomycetota bacterium]
SKVTADHPAVRAAVSDVEARTNRLLSINGNRTVDSFHRELGKIVWEYCGMERTEEGLQKALSEIPALEQEFHKDVRVPGSADNLNSSLEKAGRVADFFELAKLLARDALEREESCGGHFRAEHQSEEGEAKRDDDNFMHVAAWEWNGADNDSTRHTEPLIAEHVQPSTRSYK